MNFDPLARAYRWLEWLSFGRALEQRRFAYLPQCAQATRLLLLGEGDGRFLAQLLHANPQAQVEVIDASHQMLAQAKNQLPPLPANVAFHHANALSFPLPSAHYDCLVTHFFLDCFSQTDAERLIEGAAQSLRPGGLWVLSEFSTTGAGAWWKAPLVRLMYAFFRLTCGLTTQRIPRYHAALERSGLTLRAQQIAWAGLLRSELWQKNSN
ncbi:MAG: class I SAM-dependent methyltransferase [Bryobacter sp.]|nr:class I SAM-dependent methyltransferase [Bryobacter sp.]